MKSKRFNDQSELTTPPPIRDNNPSSTKKSADSTINRIELLDQKPSSDVFPKQPQSEHQQPNPSQMISLQSQRNSYANANQPIQQGPITSIQKPLQQNNADSRFRSDNVYQLGNPLPKVTDRFVPPQQNPSPAQLNSPSSTPSLQHTRQLSKSTETGADLAPDGPSFQPLIIANQNENIQNPQIQPKPQQLPSQSDKQLQVDLEQEQELKPVLQQNNQLQQSEDDHYQHQHRHDHQLPEHEETSSSTSAAHVSVTGHEVSTSLQKTNEPLYSSHDSDNSVDHSSSDDEQSSSSEYIGRASMNIF